MICTFSKDITSCLSYTRIHVCIYMYMCVCKCLYVCTHVYVYLCAYIWMHIYVCMYIYIYIYVLTPTNIEYMRSVLMSWLSVYACAQDSCIRMRSRLPRMLSACAQMYTLSQDSDVYTEPGHHNCESYTRI